MSATAPSLETSLIRWRNNLIDLTRRNPLLALRPTRSSFLEITAPDVFAIFEHLVVQNKACTFWMPPAKDDKPAARSEQPRATELVTGEEDRQRLLQVLTNLYRRYQSDYRERGLHILYLAVGVLEWHDAEDEPLRSPLLMVPVVLKRKSLQEPFGLAALEEDPFLNPALAARLKQDFDFSLPDLPEDWAEKSLSAYLADVAKAIQGLPGWKVEPAALVSLFSFFKGVIFQDLQDNAERLKAHAVVQALAGLPATFKKATPSSEQELDDQQDPAQTYHILDADSSQRLCLESAVREESFVLIGPPGTGKSQTIANLIADQVARGKRVLFVSEKMAALEVVYQRLRNVGLGDFCLELHSSKASKRAVVAELARNLQERAQAAASSADFGMLKDRRDQLNRYVRALHAVREPMRRSAWEVLAELPRWQAVRALPLGLSTERAEGAPAAALTVTDITPAQLDDLKQLLARLQQLWHVRIDPHYPWKGFRADRFTLQLRDDVVGLIDKVRGRIDKLKAVADQYAGKLGVSGPAPWLLKIGEVLDSRPGIVPATWLTETDISGLADGLEKCAEQYQRLGQARAPLTQKYGAGLWKLAPGTAARLDDAWKTAAALLAPADDRGASLLASQQKLRAWAADTLKKVPGWITEARTLEKWLAVPVPLGTGALQHKAAAGESHLDPAPRALRRLLRLANICMAENAPERQWLHAPEALSEAQALVAASRPVFASYHERRKQLLNTYLEQFFELELVRIAQGYAGPYRSWLRVFNGQYRRDRRAIQRRTRGEVLLRSVAADVAVGGALQADKLRLDGERPRRQAVLGRYENGMDTDWESAERATKFAAEALQLAHQLGCSSLPARLVDSLCATTPPQEKIRAAFKRLNDSFSHWHHATQELHELLPTDAMPGFSEELDACSLSALTTYARDLQTALNTLGGICDSIVAHAPDAPPDLAMLVADLHQAEDLLTWEASQETEAPRWAARFGPGFQGIGTNWDVLRKELAWARRLRDCFKAAPAGDRFIGLAVGSGSFPGLQDLKHAQEHYEQALHGFEVRFDAPGPLLDGKRYLEQPPDVVHQHLTRLRERVGELSDWIDYRHLPDRFRHLGLQAFWDRLGEEPPPPEQVVDVFLKSFWSAWSEAIFQQDPVLAGFRRIEHERILGEFQELDRELVRQGAGRVVEKAGADAAALFPDEATVLSKEAHKKTKHWPLRRLFDAIPNLVLKLKPCLLMSPLSVSQFLPADPGKMLFDVVVFDEASQILPEDALGAIYRGRQVVITGDNRQLPPTTFFQQIAGDGDDDDTAQEETPLFESILDACLGAGLPQKLLRWHYRSRHEHLIAFSNERFYDGRLVTFPAALAEHPGLGVKFHHVPDGVYDRGGRRDNVREAEVVADLVFDHYHRTPEQTLGVIAFSFAQMNAIEDEIERRLRKAPDLERFFQEDRLEGFFIKNLETVQGDERDVIFLSVGYGRDASGKLAQNFGPLNREGGARRLNVAVTRARRKLVLVSSLRAADLDGDSRAVDHLRRYLDFAERGIATLTPDEAAAEEPHGLEKEVLDVLAGLGYQGVSQVGCSAVRIDLGVLDPRAPGCFLLGIEFDGPSYRQAGTARDRDRLRPEVLQQLGWNLHRIWAPDWLYRRDEEIERLAGALKETASCKPKTP